MARVLKEYPEVVLNLEELEGKIKFDKLFGRPGPVHIEIGTGKATFLVSQAKIRFDVNFLGIERANKYYKHTVDRIGRWNLTNVRMVHTDAASFLRDFVPDHSVDCFHIYFPDPWPKRRHHKRRFLCSANIEHLIRCLDKAGTIRIATDHADYFDEIKRLIVSQANRLEEIEFVPAAGAGPGELTCTNYERKYVRDKRHIFTLAVRKT